MALQNLPVTFAVDRGGLTGPDGPTHHGCFDIPYMRLFPNMTCLAPGDERDVRPMLDSALKHAGPTTIRYPKANLEQMERMDGAAAPMELGKAEVLSWGEDGVLHRLRHLLSNCVAAAKKLAAEGLDIGVINARFVKPLDRDTILKAVETLPLVVTVEEGTLEGGFGSAVLEAANAAGLDTRTWSAAASRTASSSTPSGANCWPTWGWTRRGWRRRYGRASARESSTLHG